MNNVLEGPYFVHPRVYLNLFGLWPFQKPGLQIFLRVLASISCLTTFIPHVSKVYELRHNFHYVLLCVPSIVYYVQYSMKTSSMIVNQKKLRNILELIREDYQTYKGEQLEILHKYANLTRRFCNGYATYFFLNAILYNLPAFTPVILDILQPLNESRSKRPPRLIRYHVKRFDNSFWMLSLHGMVLDFVVMTLLVGFDTLMFNITQHACALFRIVVIEMRQTMGEVRQGRMKKGGKDQLEGELYQKIVGIIVKHRRAIEFVDLVESTYAIINFLVIASTLGSVTLAEFETVYNKHDHEIMARYIVYASVELIHILFHNYPAQRIKDHSLMVYQSCYDTEWYREDVPTDCKKLINLMMLRSQKPSCLTGAGLYDLSLENFAKILKASLSYFTFLRSIQ